MRIAIIADSNSIHIHTYIKNIAVRLSDEITVFNSTNTFTSEKSSELYKALNVKWVDFKEKLNPFFMKIPKIRGKYMLSVAQKTLKYLGEFDVYQVHMLSQFSCNTVLPNSDRCKTLVLNYWGSDLMRSNEHTRVLQRKLVKEASFVIVQTNEMKDFFCEFVCPDSCDKVEVVKFPCDSIEYVSQVKKQFEKDNKKTVIACGYNLTEEQQHLKILEEISRLPAQYKNRICILLLLTYGNADEEYKNKVTKHAQTLGVDLIIKSDFLSREEMTKYNLMTDIYINGLKTDAFSGTMQEFLVSGAVMVCGSWLGYKDIITNGGFYLKYDNFDELMPVLVDVLDNLSEYKEKAKQNEEVILNVSSIDAVVKKYKEIL